MTGFREKSIFVWNDATIGDASRVVELLKAGNFEGAYLHSTHTTNWRTPSRVALARALKQAGFEVYGSCAVYATATAAATEGHQAAAIVNEYGLAGMVFDVESGRYEEPAAGPGLVRDLFTGYQEMTARPSAFCGWPFYHSTTNPDRIYHPVAVLIEAAKLADVVMPMAYPEGDNNPLAALAYLEAVWSQWRAYTSKPIVVAGRAFNGGGGLANASSIVPYAVRSRELGAIGMTWWSMEHALDKYNLPGVWQALAQTPKISDQSVEEPMENLYKSKAMLLLTDNAKWSNTAFAGYVGYVGKNLETEQPNQDLAPIERKARGEGKPFGVLYDFDMRYYTGNQTPRDPALWPPYNLDYPLKGFCEAIRARDIDFVVIRVMDPNDHTGKPGDAGWISYAAQTYVNNVFNFLKQNKPGVKLIVASSDAFMTQYAPAMKNWIGNWQNWIDQIVPAHDESYPRTTDKPWYLGAAETWHFWRYLNGPAMGLVLFNGDEAALREWSGAETQDPGTDGPGQDDGNNQTGDLAQVLELLRALHEQNNLILARLDLIDAGQDELARDHERIAADAAATRAHFR